MAHWGQTVNLREQDFLYLARVVSSGLQSFTDNASAPSQTSDWVGLARNVSVIYSEVACWSASDFARAPRPFSLG